MARISNEQRLVNVHADALVQFDRIFSATWDIRQQCLQDRRFYSIAGAQWEGNLAEQFANKPKFEINKVLLAVTRVINEYRNNRITVDFVSKDGSADERLADTLDSLYRADEQDSGAEEAYDCSFEEAVGGGFGAWRLRTEYEDEDEEEGPQRIRIIPIPDGDTSVFFDLDAKRQNKADAKHCFVLHSMTQEGYEAEYGDSPSTWPATVTEREFDWATPNLVYVAEYYVVEKVKTKVEIWQSIDGSEERYTEDDFERDEELRDRLTAIGSRQAGEKITKTRKVRKYILSGGKVLEDCGYIAGKNIPVIPVYGKRWFVDGVERYMGHVRPAKDSQRLKNMQLSKLAEISALSSLSKPIFTPEQMAGHQMMWSQDNIKDYPYLLMNPVTDANGQPAIIPPSYTKVPEIPPAMAALLQLTEQDMAELMGNQQQADKMVSNISGKAVEMIQARIDMQAYIYMSNMSKAVRRCGEVWLSMAKDVYVEDGRKMKGVGRTGEINSVVLNKPVGVPGGVEYENDLTAAKFDVAVDVGPSSSSRKAAVVRALTGLMAITTDPETVQVLGAAALMNMEGEGMDDLRKFYRKKLVTMGVVEPTEEEKQKLAAAEANREPDANALYLQAAAEEAQASAVKARDRKSVG